MRNNSRRVGPRQFPKSQSDQRTPPRHPPSAEKPVERLPRTHYLRQWRKYRGLTLEEAAECAGTTAGNLSNIERGRYGWSLNLLDSLSRVYQCFPEDLTMINPDNGNHISMWGMWHSASADQQQVITQITAGYLRRPGLIRDLNGTHNGKEE